MDTLTCFNKYWETHPEEELLWNSIQPYVIIHLYGFQDNKLIDSLKQFNPDNPEVLNYMLLHYLINKDIVNAINCINRLKELYPENNQCWDLNISWINSIEHKLNDIIIPPKVESLSEFIGLFQ